ncbi:DUF1573 domain-containing protein [Draconibacterium halophilum]|uniref:DUF1573 domain-containing protein n=1 Tax=Draconibacterium halophilum TaxID=2706887 RepID=A0A6C0RDT4_9BACT|nr:DUF1573 domain-containing protein [Draconibacterium halophilum]QIA07311.1 DUF1573 domain-containing protein [Draconibacterium halophilum]
MKRILQLLAVFSLVVAFNSAMGQGTPKIVFEEQSHDFGSFKESDGVQKTTFNFTNKGEAPLVLSNVRASCGCTTPKWTREPVAPGESGSIDVSYNPKNRPGSFNKSVTVSSNAENRTVVLRINGKVEPREKTLAEKYPRKIGDLRVKSNYLSFAKIKKGETVTKELELVNDTDKPVEVGFRTVPKHLTAKAEPQTIPAKGKGKLVVTYDSDAANTFGFASHRIYLSLDGSNNYKNSVGVSATIEEDFSKLSPEELANAPVANFNEKSVDFGEMNQGDKKEHTFTLTNNGKTDLIIRRVRSSCGCTAVAPSKKVIAAGETAPIKVTFDSRGKRGRQSKSITVITNDPKTPTSTLRISSQVVVASAG